jgi:hypothetical protein
MLTKKGLAVLARGNIVESATCSNNITMLMVIHPDLEMIAQTKSTNTVCVANVLDWWDIVVSYV